MERLNPLNDFLFMKAFGEKGAEEQLLDFLNVVLSRPGRDRLTSVEILENKTLTADYIGDKSSMLDVRARTDKGDYADIEVQLKDLHNMDRRSLFYWGKQYVKDMKAGDDYGELPNVITINIVDFDFIPLDDFHTSFHLREDRNTDYILTDALEIHFINMVKFRKLKNKDIQNDLVRWFTYFDKNTPPDILEEVVKMDTAIKKVDERYTFLSQDEETRRMYDLRQMGQMDWNSVINERDRERAARLEAERRAAEERTTRLEAERRAAEERTTRLEAERRAAELERRIAELEARS